MTLTAQFAALVRLFDFRDSHLGGREVTLAIMMLSTASPSLKVAAPDQESGYTR